jgi:aspartate aminotransferase
MSQGYAFLTKEGGTLNTAMEYPRTPAMRNNPIAGAARACGHVCPPTLIQLAVERCADEMPNLVAYNENRTLLYDELTKMGYECAKPDGAFYLFVKVPNGDAMAFSEKAKLEYNLLVVPADGFECPGYMRLSYCVSNAMIRRSLPAFKAMIESYK